MLNGIHVVFDDNIQQKQASVVALSSLEFTDVLGNADALILQANLTTLTGGPLTSLTVTIQSSGEGRLWVNKNPNPEISVVTSSSLTGGVFSGAEPVPTPPNMKFTRLRIETTTAPAKGFGAAFKLKVFVTSRSRTKRLRRIPLPPPQQRRTQLFTPEIAQELDTHLRGSAHLSGADRIAHVLGNLSGPARVEVDNLTTKLVGMHPAVKASIGQAASALAALMKARPGPGDQTDDVVSRAFREGGSRIGDGTSD